MVRSLNAQSVTGFSQFGAQSSNPQFQNPTIYNPKANFTWIKSKHSMKFGYEWQGCKYRSSTTSTRAMVRTTMLDSLHAADLHKCEHIRRGPDSAGSQPCGLHVGQPLSVFADDIRDCAPAATVSTSCTSRMTSKSTPRLTVNAGLRYEIVTPQYEKDNRLANFDPGTNSLIQARSGGVYSRSLVKTLAQTNLGPRLGLCVLGDGQDRSARRLRNCLLHSGTAQAVKTT